MGCLAPCHRLELREGRLRCRMGESKPDCRHSTNAKNIVRGVTVFYNNTGNLNQLHFNDAIRLSRDWSYRNQIRLSLVSGTNRETRRVCPEGNLFSTPTLQLVAKAVSPLEIPFSSSRLYAKKALYLFCHTPEKSM